MVSADQYVIRTSAACLCTSLKGLLDGGMVIELLVHSDLLCLCTTVNTVIYPLALRVEVRRWVLESVLKLSNSPADKTALNYY